MVKLDETGTCDIFPGPAIATNTACYTEAACSAAFFPNVVGTASAAAAANVCLFISFSKGGSSFTHCSSLGLFLRFFACRLG